MSPLPYGRGSLLLLIAAIAAAQTPSEVRGRKIVDDAIAALGGEKFLNMQDRVESGRAYSFYRDELRGLSVATIYTRYQGVTPRKAGSELGLRERQSFGKKDEDSAVLFSED